MPAEVVGLLAADAVALEHVLRLVGQVEHLGGLGLHAKRQLERLNHALQVVADWRAALVVAIELLQESELLLLQVARQVVAAEVANAGIFGFCLHPAYHRALVDSGQERIAEFPRATAGVGTNGNERWQRLILRSQSIRNPRTNRRADERIGPGMHP